jgi:CRP/FNR family transcriptional regulator, anaerobic regulatory protein
MVKAPIADDAMRLAPGPHALLFPPRNSLHAGAFDDGAPEGRELHFPPRALIFREGDAANCVLQVDDGTVMLYQLLPDGRRQVVELLQKGDIFGFSATPVHDCSAEALVETSCTAFDRGAVERSPALAQRLSASAFSQLCGLHEHIMLLGRKSAAERIASFLMRFIPGRGRGKCPGPPKGHDSARVPLAMTRLEIADFLGLTIETVSRVLTRLKRRGILSIKRLDEISVCDVCSLCRLSGTHLTNGRWCSSRGEAESRNSSSLIRHTSTSPPAEPSPGSIPSRPGSR